ncbi:hypothetical protein BDQ17DRAFT_160132 [Cyathus striatus]|nr:hypothetical protein BDQ17DRAFT_160132 [Cyathus striatus]
MLIFARLPTAMTKLTTSQFIQFCLQYSSLALLYYDYFLTLGREIKYIWLGKIRLSTLLYVFCRYAMVANVIFALVLAKKLPSMRVYFNSEIFYHN